MTPNHVLVSAENRVFALAPEDGSVQWQRKYGGEILTVADGVAVVNDHGRLLAVEVSNGRTRWTVQPPTDHATWSQSLHIHDGTVYVGCAQFESLQTNFENEFGRVYSIDITSGKRSRLADLASEDGQPVEAEYVLADETGIYTTLERGGLFGLESDGTIRWRRHGEGWAYPPVRTGRFVVQPWGHGVVAVDVDTGDTGWRSERPQMNVVASDGTVYGAGRDGANSTTLLWALGADSGDPLWKSELQGCGRTLAVGAGVLATHVGCGPSEHVEVVDTNSGCHYASIEQPTSGVPGFDIAGGTLYASLQGESDRLVAVELP